MAILFDRCPADPAKAQLPRLNANAALTSLCYRSDYNNRLKALLARLFEKALAVGRNDV